MAQGEELSDEEMLDTIKGKVGELEESDTGDFGEPDFEEQFSEPGQAEPKQEQPSALGEGIYKQLEDQWYKLLDKIDEYVPIYKVIDPIEQFVPSFPLFLGIVALLLIGGIIGILLLASGDGTIFGSGEYAFKTIEEGGKTIDFVNVSIAAGGEVFEAETDEFGETRIRLPQSDVFVSAIKDGYVNFEENLSLISGGFNEIVLVKEAIQFAKKTLKIYNGSTLFSGEATVIFSCSNPNAVPPSQRTTSTGIITDILVPENCGTLSYRIIADGFEEREYTFGSGTTQSITLTPTQQPKGSIRVNVFNVDTLEPVRDAGLDLYRSDSSFVKSQSSGSTGIALFEDIKPGAYYISATQVANYSDVPQSASIAVVAERITVFDLALSPYTGEVKKIFGKLVDMDSGEPIGDATIKLIVDKHLTSNEFYSIDDGTFQILDLQENEYGLLVTHEDFLSKQFTDVTTLPENASTPTVFELERATSENSGSVKVVVKDSDGDEVEDAQVTLFSDILGVPLQGKTNSSGELLFENMPPGDYRAFAEVDGASGESEELTLSEGTTLTLNVRLVTARGNIKVKVVDKSTGAGIGNALVKIIKHGSTDQLIQQLLTGDNGETEELSLLVGQSVYAEVAVVDGYKTPFVSVPVKVEENKSKTITVRLESGEVSSDEFSISFDPAKDIFKPDQSQFIGILAENSDYLLRYTMTIGDNFDDSKAVIRIGEQSLAASDVISIFGTSAEGAASFFDNCELSADTSNPYNTCDGTVTVSQGGTTAKKAVIDFSIDPSTIKQMEFFVGAHVGTLSGTTGSLSEAIKENVLFLQDSQEQNVKIFYAMATKSSGSSSFNGFDPQTGFHEATLTVGGVIPCSDPTDCPVFDITTTVTSPAVTGNGETDNPYLLDLDSTHDLKVTVANLSQNPLNGLVLQVKGPSGNIILGLGDNQERTETRTFNLTAGASKTETFRITALEESTNKFPLDIELLGRTEDEAKASAWFEINSDVDDVTGISLETNKLTLEENKNNEQVTITARNTANGIALPGVNIIMDQVTTGQGPVYDGTAVQTAADGTTTFNINDTGNIGDRFCFQGTYLALAPVELCIYVVEEQIVPPGFFVPSNIDCVRVDRETLSFDLDEAITGNVKTKSFNVSTEECEDKVELAFSKIDATDSIKILDGSSTVLSATNSFAEWTGTLDAKNDRKTFTIDISSGTCPKDNSENVNVSCSEDSTVCQSENVLCPGEYRVNVLARFEKDKDYDKPFSYAENGKVRVLAVPGTPEQGYNFDLCTDADNCTDGATFDLTNPDEMSKITNLSSPTTEVNDVFLPAVTLDTCPNEACVNRQARNFFGSIGFNFVTKTVHKEFDPQTGELKGAPIEKTGPQRTAILRSISDRIFVEPQIVDLLSEQGEAYTEYANFVDQDNHTVELSFETSIPNPSFDDLGFEPKIVLSHDGTNIFATLNGKDTLTGNEIEFNVENYAVQKNKGALLDVFDYVSDGLEQGFTIVSYDLKVEGLDDSGTVLCSKIKSVSQQADGESILFAGSSANVLLDCAEQAQTFRATVISSSITPTPNYTGTIGVQVFYGDETNNTTTSKDETVTGRIVELISSEPIDMQLVFLVDPTSAMDIWWELLCNTTWIDDMKNYFTEHGGRNIETQIWSIGVQRPGTESCVDGVTEWKDEWAVRQDNRIPEIGALQGNDFYSNFSREIGCSGFLASCSDAKAEAWGPGLLYLIDGEDGVEWNAEASDKVIVVISDSDPTGAQQDNLFRWRDDYGTNQWFPGLLGGFFGFSATSNRFPLGQKEEDMVNLVIAAFNGKKRDVGNIKTFFWNSRLRINQNTSELESPEDFEYLSKTFWTGQNASENEFDIKESMLAVANATGGKVGVNSSPTNEVDFVRIAVQDLVSSVYPKDHQRFHVILEAGEENVCIGHNGLEGVTGSNAIDSLRRDFSWIWKSSTAQSARKLDYCNPRQYGTDAPNTDFVYCDAVQFQQMVLERILQINQEYKQGTPPTTTLNELENFSSALIVDGYGEDFLNDFKGLKNTDYGAFGSAPSGVFANDFDYVKYVDDGKFGYTITDADAFNVLPTSGFYNVNIDIDFDSGNSGNFLKGNGEPWATITVNLTLNKPINSDNLLYSLPFDGGLGKDPEKDEFDRQHYGVDYSGDVIKLFEENLLGAFETLNKSSSSNALFEVNVTDLSKQSNEEELFKRLNTGLDSFDGTRGVVFKLEKTGEKEFELEYSPGYAAPVLMSLERTDSANQNFVQGFYAISNSPTNYIDFGEETGASWSGIASSAGEDTCRDFEGNLLFKNQPAEQESSVTSSNCSVNNGLSGDNAYGFSFGIDGALSDDGQKVVLGSIIFVPKKDTYSLVNACSNNSTATFHSISNSTTNSSLNLGASASLPVDTIDSVADIMNGVREDAAKGTPVFCIYNQADSMEIWFNEKGILQRILDRDNLGQRSGARTLLGDSELDFCSANQ